MCISAWKANCHATPIVFAEELGVHDPRVLQGPLCMQNRKVLPYAGARNSYARTESRGIARLTLIGHRRRAAQVTDRHALISCTDESLVSALTWRRFVASK